MKYISSIVLSLMYVCRQSAKFLSVKYANFLGGNVDLFYFLSLLEVKNFLKSKEELKKILLIFLAFLLYAIFQFLIIQDLNIFRLLINVAKIMICILLYRYCIKNFHKFNIAVFSITSVLLLTLQTVLALIFNSSSIFWRFNDGVNYFNLTRLQHFYLEPSELGFHLMLLIILFVSLFLYSKDIKQKNFFILAILFLGITLYLAKPMGAIGIGALAICVMILYDYYLNPSLKKKRILFIGGTALIIIMFVLYFTDNPLLLRALYTLEGKDLSNNYRIGVSLNVLKESLIDYKFIGCGFGNLHSENFISNYTHLGLTTVVVNSFIYFIIETGLFGIVFVGILIFNLMKSSINAKSPLKLGLALFIILYSFVGGHFTSSVAWIVYAFIMSSSGESLFFENIREIISKKGKGKKYE